MRQPANAINRALREGRNLYCNRACAGLSRRKPERPDAERRADKAAYDRRYRTKNAERIRARKAEYFQRTYDPDAAREYRKTIMPRHVEYCRQPAYRAKKAVYDQKRRDNQAYGEFAEAAAILRDLEAEVLSRASRYDLYQATGRLNKTTKRKRAYVNAQPISG